MVFEKQFELLKETCKELLEQNKVDLILGFTTDENSSSAIPFFIRTPEDLEKLRWDDYCVPNLAKYLLENKKKVAIVAKPCDSRAIAMYIVEGQLDRKDVFIIGMECAGMKSKDSTPAPWCLECDVRIPPVYDILIRGEGIEKTPEITSTASNTAAIAAKEAAAVAAATGDTGTINNAETIEDTADTETMADTADTAVAANMAQSFVEIEKSNNDSSNDLSSKNKLSRFMNEINRCILCFSCRQACYGCYCGTCFIEKGIPNWQPSDVDSGKKMMFHLGRAMHLAGRCVECGACERVCPSGVNIRYLIRELTDFCEDLYGYRAGLNLDEEPVLTSFRQNDKEVGFLGGEDDV